MDKYIDSFMNENELSFNDFFEKHRLNHIVKRKDYIELKNKRNKIYSKYPELQHFIEDNRPINFNDELMDVFNELVTIYFLMDKIELKEAYKLGARDSYIFMEDMDMINI
jgi:hypothetical protein